MKKRTMLMAVLVLGLFASSLLAEVVKTDRYTKRYIIDENGEKMTVMNYAGFPPKELPPANVPLPKGSDPKLTFTLANVPSYTWCYGCTATATGIIAAYYDNFGAPTVYTGPANGGLAPQTNTVWQTATQPDTDQCPLTASKSGVDGRATRGHGDDYWTGYLDEATDPYYGAWTEHDHNSGQRSAADFMGTNQWYNWENADGSTSIWSSPSGVFDYSGSEGSTPALRDGIHGVKLFYESLGMTVDKNYTRTITGYNDPDDNPDMGPATGGYEFSMYKASIDAGRPVYIQIEGHSMVGLGYNDTATPATLYLRDTWDTNTSPTAHSMVWGALYSNMQHYAISEVVLGTECYYAAPENVFALNNNRSVTVSWSDPSKGTKSMSYIVFRDGAQIATGVTATSYVDNGASDGLHNWSVKAYYISNSFTSYMSLAAQAYVSPSVTSFTDDFERTVITDKWLFNPLSGQIAAWGRDTQYKYAGLASLSDSPAANYTDNTDQLATGGSIAEVAPGLNFSTAADATCTFWLRYAIEESFDYLHFQACDDGVSWETLKTWSSEALGLTFYQETIGLGLFAGNSNVRFRFILVTDPGYNAAGSNIDDIAITPSTVDSSAPYVFYTKDKDWHSEKADGFEITTRITDYTGISYARCYYKINGGAESYVNPTTVTGTSKDAIYFWKLTEKTAGDLVEFRIEARDTYSTPNTASKGPFQYREGLHQKYDYGSVTYIQNIMKTPNETDGTETCKSYAVKFSSFMDDVCGVVVRGYDDASQPLDNAQMLINVWANDNGGIPGTLLITPVAITNPATLQDTNAWTYVDLSSFTALDNMVGDYFVGIRCGLSPDTGVTMTCESTTGMESEYDFGRAYGENLVGGVLSWAKQVGHNYHIRCVTTDKQIQPGIIDPSPNALAKTVIPNGTATDALTVINAGGYQLDYTGSIAYNGTAGAALVHENLFTTVLGWTSAGTRAWTRTTATPTLNGSAYATVSAATTGGAVTNHSYLTSAVINMAAYGEGSTISFQQYKSAATSTGAVEVSIDGTNWFSIYSNTAIVGAMGTPDTQTITIPPAYVKATTRFRFHASLPKSSGSWNIDNIQVNGVVPFSWMTLDGAATTSGSVAVGGSDGITVGYNAAGLAEGTYTANIRLTSLYSNESVFVELEVLNATPPVAPSLVSPTNASTMVDITPYFDWSTVSGATEYNIVVDNNADFLSPEINTEVTASEFQQLANLAVGTYNWKVRSKNAAGYSAYTSTWTVTLQAPVSTYSESSLAGAAIVGNSDSDIFNIGNTGNASLTYSITTSYVTAKADIALLNNNFNSVLGWTPSDYLVWAQSTDLNYDIDATGYARLAADTGGDANGSAAGVLTSTVFDGTAAYEVWIDFDQNAILTTSSCLVDYTIDGVTWINVYTNAITTTAHQRIKLPTKSATMQVRFKANLKNQSGSSWNVDNVVIAGLNPANYGWLSVLPLSGSVAIAGSTPITATYNSTGMDVGTYNANITITTNDPYTPTKVIPVQFVVNTGTIIPGVAANVTTSIVSGNVYINWDDAADATSYDVYSSATPYGTFALLTNVAVSEYTYTPTATKMFFYIVSKNTTKKSPETIEVGATKR